MSDSVTMQTTAASASGKGAEVLKWFSCRYFMDTHTMWRHGCPLFRLGADPHTLPCLRLEPGKLEPRAWPTLVWNAQTPPGSGTHGI